MSNLLSNFTNSGPVSGGSGSGTETWASASSSYSPWPSDVDNVRADVSGGGFTISLPDASAHSGRRIRVKDSGSASSTKVITITAPVSNQIDGAFTSVTITSPRVSSTFVSDGTLWNIV